LIRERRRPPCAVTAFLKSDGLEECALAYGQIVSAKSQRLGEASTSFNPSSQRKLGSPCLYGLREEEKRFQLSLE
jgi:hypothetical protein